MELVDLRGWLEEAHSQLKAEWLLSSEESRWRMTVPRYNGRWAPDSFTVEVATRTILYRLDETNALGDPREYISASVAYLATPMREVESIQEAGHSC